jgi:hypothetical protein
MTLSVSRGRHRSLSLVQATVPAYQDRSRLWTVRAVLVSPSPIKAHRGHSASSSSTGSRSRRPRQRSSSRRRGARCSSGAGTSPSSSPISHYGTAAARSRVTSAARTGAPSSRCRRSASASEAAASARAPQADRGACCRCGVVSLTAASRTSHPAAIRSDDGRGSRCLSYAEHVFGPKVVTSTTARSIRRSNS